MWSTTLEKHVHSDTHYTANHQLQSWAPGCVDAISISDKEELSAQLGKVKELVEDAEYDGTAPPWLLRELDYLRSLVR